MFGGGKLRVVESCTLAMKLRTLYSLPLAPFFLSPPLPPLFLANSKAAFEIPDMPV